jgi:hypothetical protein
MSRDISCRRTRFLWQREFIGLCIVWLFR